MNEKGNDDDDDETLSLAVPGHAGSRSRRPPAWAVLAYAIVVTDMSHYAAGRKPRRLGARVKRFLQSWLINTLAVVLAVYLVPGITYRKPLDLLAASLLLGILNAVLRPVLMLLALPLLILTLGLFTFVINALLLYLVGNLLRPEFSVETFWAAFWGGLVISVVTLILNSLTGTGSSRIRFERHRRRSGSNPPGDGPVIDV